MQPNEILEISRLVIADLSLCSNHIKNGFDLMVLNELVEKIELILVLQKLKIEHTELSKEAFLLYQANKVYSNAV